MHAVKCFSVGCQRFSVSAMSHLAFLSPVCKSGVCFGWLCVQREALLHPNPSAAAELHRECVTENTIYPFIGGDE